MKRILAMSLIVMTILLSFTGCEWFASEEDVVVGEMEINWDPDDTSKITLDSVLCYVMPLYDEDGTVNWQFVELNETTDFCYVPVNVGNVSAYSDWEMVCDEDAFYYKVPVYAEIENGKNYYYKVPVSDENKSAYSELDPVYDENESTYYYKVFFLMGIKKSETSENDRND